MTTPAPAAGETSLNTLLSSLTPVLHPSTFCFLTLSPGTNPPPSLEARLSFLEAEGWTLITTPEAAAGHGLTYTFPCRMITLNVHSSLEAVGFIAYVAGKLSARGIGTNPVSGFWHDHVFVPVGKEGEAMEVLEGIRAEAEEGKAADGDDLLG